MTVLLGCRCRARGRGFALSLSGTEPARVPLHHPSLDPGKVSAAPV